MNRMNPNHLKILNEGVDAWNRWRGKNPEVRADLFRADLPEADLFGANLREAKLNEAILRGADLFGADLSGANLRGADLGRTSLSEADFSQAELGQANLSGAKLYRANLEGAVGLRQEQVNSAKGDENTQLPEGIQHPAHWDKKRAMYP